jgi:DNA-dependent RNA polymerase auxiliary subunit epsilon
MMKKKTLGLILGLVLALALAGCGNGETTPPENGEQEDQASDTVKSPTWGNGTYLVGSDIESGLYRAKVTDQVTKMGYIERASDVSMDFEDIIANVILTGDGYVTIKSTDAAVKLQGVELSQIDLATLEPNLQQSASGGMYLVGYDLAPGTYKVEVTDTTMNMAYVERLSDASMDFENIIANEIFQGQGYVKIQEGDFAVRVQGGTLTLQE